MTSSWVLGSAHRRMSKEELERVLAVTRKKVLLGTHKAGTTNMNSLLSAPLKPAVLKNSSGASKQVEIKALNMCLDKLSHKLAKARGTRTPARAGTGTTPTSSPSHPEAGTPGKGFCGRGPAVNHKALLSVRVGE